VCATLKVRSLEQLSDMWCDLVCFSEPQSQAADEARPHVYILKMNQLTQCKGG